LLVPASHGGLRREWTIVVEREKRNLSPHGIIGLAIIAAAELALVAGTRWVRMYFTPIAWTGYIMFVDSLIALRKGGSPLTTRRKEFLLVVPISIITWYLFEGINLLLKNWSYTNLPESTAARWLGYAWSYATITPGIFVTAELIDTFIGERLNHRRPLDFGRRTEIAFFYIGFFLLVVVLLFPSKYLCPLPWISVLLWFEGMNDRLRIGSFSQMFRSGDYGLFVSLLVSGAVCGVLWEFWNFWALTKWNYHVPFLPEVKLFEMPVLGYLGFPPFALECFLIYRFIRTLVPARRTVDVLGRGWDAPLAGEVR
jgi:hypothetical protein